jgi:hypothetical protein
MTNGKLGLLPSMKKNPNYLFFNQFSGKKNTHVYSNLIPDKIVR